MTVDEAPDVRPLEEATTQLVRKVADEIHSLDLDYPARIGVDGFCAAGKTTIAEALAAVLSASGAEVIRVSTDDYQNPPEVRWQLGDSSPEGFYRHAVDFDTMEREVLAPLGPSGSKLYRTSSYDIFARRPHVSEQSVAPDDGVLLLDGLFLHTERIARALDYTIFVDAPFDICVERARARNQERREDAAAVERLYRSRYIPGFQLYLSECHPREVASATIPNG